MELSKTDYAYLERNGIDKHAIKEQLDNFDKGFPFINLDAPATTENGIVRLSDSEIDQYAASYDRENGDLRILKFVPASGAASRMFKDLVDLELKCNTPEQIDDFAEAKKCLTNLPRFAFIDSLRSKLRKHDMNFDQMSVEKDYKALAKFILHEEGLDYQNRPKAMVAFHKYENEARTAFEEHLVEGAAYAANQNREVNLHFTISPEHRILFENKIAAVKTAYEERFGVRYNISFSEQKSSTNMVAVDMQGELVRKPNGDLLLRPGGHGSLIENLNDCDADLIFIKNIDNVTVDRLRETTIKYKKALAGYLLRQRNQVFEYLEKLDSLEINEHDLAQIESFARQNLGIHVPMKYFGQSLREKVIFWQKKLNRPIRICGMVRNEGEPGGGPFWVNGENGELSLQVVESSQINSNNAQQMRILSQSTHFNPVDLVCCTKNYKGNNFYLPNYIDPKTGFISKKKQNGIEMRIQERPGLWNGAMANWNTIFVEVPVETFTPVKMLSDLLRPQHQGEA
ncbi:MAG: DUF4301 family protein [Paludibacteraceae bacterium]|nr:DUF4301 family protein [Paludibacteraceae bacterium]